MGINGWGEGGRCSEGQNSTLALVPLDPEPTPGRASDPLCLQADEKDCKCNRA